MDKKLDRTFSGSFFAVPLLIALLVAGELLIWVFPGPSILGSKIVMGILVFLVTGMMIMVLSALQNSYEESGRPVKFLKFAIITSLVLSGLAFLQFALIALMGIWKVAFLVFLAGLLFRS